MEKINKMSFTTIKRAVCTIFLLFNAVVFAQTTEPVSPTVVPVLPTTLSQVQLPAYIMFGVARNQFTGTNAFISGIIPESNKVGLYGSVTTDISGIQITDPTTKKLGYVLSPSVRAGQYKTLFNDGKNMLLAGGDLGASFSQIATATTSGTPVASTGVSIGLAGSFTVVYVRQLSTHFAIGVPVQMLWMSGVGPNGTGVWNPVVKFGFIWKPL